MTQPSENHKIIRVQICGFNPADQRRILQLESQGLRPLEIARNLQLPMRHANRVIDFLRAHGITIPERRLAS